jgi:hypothetical protein
MQLWDEGCRPNSQAFIDGSTETVTDILSYQIWSESES